MSHALPREWFGGSIRNDSLRREKARLRAGAIIGYVAVVSLAVAALLFYILQGVQVIQAGYEIDQLRSSLQELRTERDRLEVELASLQNLSAVERLAVRDLGMIRPEEGQVTVVQVAERDEAPPASDPSVQEEPADNRLLVLLRKLTRAL